MVSERSIERRRVTRVTVPIPITVSGVDLLGQSFVEHATTINVGHRGCLYASKHHLPRATVVTIQLGEQTLPARAFRARVVWVGRPHTIRELFRVAVEFETSENVWKDVLPAKSNSLPTPTSNAAKTLGEVMIAAFEENETTAFADFLKKAEQIIVEESHSERKAHRSPAARASEPNGPPALPVVTVREKHWDVFICHASEDKRDFVRPLANELKAAGLEVWYDEFSMKVGDSLRRSIDRGLAKSKFGVVVLSPSFFRKEWPKKELDGLVAKEIDDRRIILPVWHNVSKAEVETYSVTLADRVALNSTDGVRAVARRLIQVIKNTD